MKKFACVHPVITKIDKTSDNNYLVYETLKPGFIPFSFTYPVTIESRQLDNSVTIRVIVMKLIKIEMKFVLKKDKDFTIIEENIKFKSPLLLQSLIGKNFYRATYPDVQKYRGSVVELFLEGIFNKD
ncbi:MAG: hypothetical protein H7296_10315 [Bacteroidia bacterium]|nr:hypothetical protein [Bacteroidia bacterium]